MKKKAAFVRASDRPAPSPLDPDTPLRELRVRDLATLLEAADKPKSLADEGILKSRLKDFFKVEKVEGSKFEVFKSEGGKWEGHGEPKGGLEPGPDPQQFGQGIKVLIEAVTELKATVEELGRKIGKTPK